MTQDSMQACCIRRANYSGMKRGDISSTTLIIQREGTAGFEADTAGKGRGQQRSLMLCLKAHLPV